MGCITGAYWPIPGERGADGLEWGEPRRMTLAGEPLAGAWRVRPSVADWNGDGSPEMLTLDERGYLSPYGRDPSGGPQHLRELGQVMDRTGAPLYLGGVNKFPMFTFAGRAKLFACDWDGDGLLELLVGTHCKMLATHTELYEQSSAHNVGAGVMLIDNVGTPGRPVWGGIYAVTELGGGPLMFGCHSCAAILVDWRADGAQTLVVGTEDGFLHQYDRGALDLSDDIVPPLPGPSGT